MEQLQGANTGKNDNMTETTIREITTKCPYRPKTTSANTGKITTMRQHRRHYYNTQHKRTTTCQHIGNTTGVSIDTDYYKYKNTILEIHFQQTMELAVALH